MSNNEHPVDAWIMALPENQYDPCPCGCGKKWRFVEREGEKEIDVHFQTFVQKLAHEQVFGNKVLPN